MNDHWKMRNKRDGYQTQVWLLAAHKPIIREASVSRKERCLIQKQWQSGEKVNSCAITHSQDSAQPSQFLKWKRRKKSQWITKAGDEILCHFQLFADWLTPPDFSLDIIDLRCPWPSVVWSRACFPRQRLKPFCGKRAPNPSHWTSGQWPGPHPLALQKKYSHKDGK